MTLHKAMCVIVLSILGPSSAYSEDSIKFEIIDYGTYQRDIHGGRIKSEEVIAGYIEPSYSMELIKATDEIDAKIGTTFGFRFKSNNKNAEQVEYCGEFPPMKNPQNGVVSTKDCYKYRLLPNKVQWHIFNIGHDWEIVPGKWTLYVIYRNKVAAKKIFTLRKM